MKGKIIKAVGGVFTVIHNDKRCALYAPKKIRYNNGDVLVGDVVEFSLTESHKGIIDRVLPRFNKLTRPEVANIDVVLILIAVEPTPDFLLVDKIIINCFANNMTPVVVVNKSDISTPTFVDFINDRFADVCDVAVISATESNGIDNLHGYFEGNTVCLAGQSAVGKTSLMNSLLPSAKGKIGALSAKVSRGTHTTRHSEIYSLLGGYIVDTSGFSLLELLDIDRQQLMLYYPEFEQFQGKCKYNMCTHTVEPDCAVKQYIADGNCIARYNSYVDLYNEMGQTAKK